MYICDYFPIYMMLTVLVAFVMQHWLLVFCLWYCWVLSAIYCAKHNQQGDDQQITAWFLSRFKTTISHSRDRHSNTVTRDAFIPDTWYKYWTQYLWPTRLVTLLSLTDRQLKTQSPGMLLLYTRGLVLVLNPRPPTHKAGHSTIKTIATISP